MNQNPMNLFVGVCQTVKELLDEIYKRIRIQIADLQ